jgi:hypothetical protein
MAGMLPGIDPQKLKMIEPDPVRLRRATERCRDDAVKASRTVNGIVLAYEAGRDGFLAGAMVARAKCRGSRGPFKPALRFPASIGAHRRP